MSSKKQAQLKMVSELNRLDHGFLDETHARTICAPFGYEPELYTAQDTRDQFKGLTIPSAKKGSYAVGVDAEDLAAQLCKHLKVEFRTFLGRGSQLAECCEQLKLHLTPKTLR